MFTIVYSVHCSERVYLSIHSGLPRASTALSVGKCPFRAILAQNFSTTAPALAQQSDVNQQKSKPGIIPKGTYVGNVIVKMWS